MNTELAEPQKNLSRRSMRCCLVCDPNEMKLEGSSLLPDGGREKADGQEQNQGRLVSDPDLSRWLDGPGEEPTLR